MSEMGGGVSSSHHHFGMCWNRSENLNDECRVDE